MTNNTNETVTLTQEQVNEIRQQTLKQKELNDLLVAEINQKREDLAYLISSNKQLGERVNLLQEELSKYEITDGDEISGD